MIIDESIELTVPVSTAYNQWTQFESFPRFMARVQNVKQLRPHLTRWTVGVGPVRHEFEAEITEQQPDSHVQWRSLGPASPHRGWVRFESAAAGRTTMQLHVDIKPAGAAGLLASTPLISTTIRAELRNFKEFIEGAGHENGAWRGLISDGHVRRTEAQPSRTQVPHWPVG